MRITHPQTMYQGMNPEDVFLVFSDNHVQMGSGYIISFMKNEVYPDRPLHFFIQIDAQPVARNLIYGALLARVEILRLATPNIPARIYTQISQEDEDWEAFYKESGFLMDDAEDTLCVSLYNDIPAQEPMGMQYASVPLENKQEQDAFLWRLNQMRISPLSYDQFLQWRDQPNFLAVGFYRNGQPICELVTSGMGANATLIMMYTNAEYRKQGYGKLLFALASSILKERGVLRVYMHVFRRNQAHVALMNCLGAEYVETKTLLPGINL